MRRSHIVFKQDPDNPAYIGTYPTIEECESVAQRQGFQCVVLIIDIDYTITKTAFEYVANIMSKLDVTWTDLVARGDIT